ncbi:YegS/Rv2252/BmrU family lipid kinase [Crocinitomix catalasitica]|nr:YegS/Rv2252/BmrU family lipid kinase [Crocinitomix catalasitica]
MADQKKILFLLNPVSGIGKKNIIPALVEKHFAMSDFEVELRHTEYRNHGHEIAKSEKINYDSIVAIGGDGSVNEVGSALVNSKCVLGIIPTGSGNGLARHLGIPLDIEKAIERIKEFNSSAIDTGKVNDRTFLGTCGFAFDAHISQKFDEFHKRGFKNYIKLVIKEFKSYKPLRIAVKGDGLDWTKELIICTVANSSQFGNGFKISPRSNTSDGIFELVQIDQFKMLKAPWLVKRFFNGTIDKSKHFSSNAVSTNFDLEVESRAEIPFHLDGEPLIGGPVFKISLNKASLFVV